VGQQAHRSFALNNETSDYLSAADDNMSTYVEITGAVRERSIDDDKVVV
jgi:hypothetical protein